MHFILFSAIETLWDDALSKGTDTYILKFHSELLIKYKVDINLCISFR